MTPDDIWDEYASNRRLSGNAMLALKQLLRESEDPYPLVTLTGDTAAFQLAQELLRFLSHQDRMVRWNAASVLFNRFRDSRLAGHCVEALQREPDDLVRGVLLTGAGELLPLLEDAVIKAALAKHLDDAFRADDESLREAAYEGMEAAIGIPPLERAPVETFDLEKDVKPSVVDEFHSRYHV